jgi:hypothetical protein
MFRFIESTPGGIMRKEIIDFFDTNRMNLKDDFFSGDSLGVDYKIPRDDGKQFADSIVNDSFLQLGVLDKFVISLGDRKNGFIMYDRIFFLSQIKKSKSRIQYQSLDSMSENERFIDRLKVMGGHGGIVNKIKVILYLHEFIVIN